MPYTLSPSSLSLLKDCPRCFWMHHNKQIKRPDTIFPSLPSGMDHILKEHFDRFMRKQQLPPELNELKDVQLFNDESLLKIWRSNRKGLEWKDNSGNLLHGAIDNLLVKNKKFIVLDYKTRGFPLKEDTHEHYQDQMDFYNFLLRKNGYQTEDYTYLLFYHPHQVEENGHVCFNTNLIKLKTNPKNAEKIFKRAIDILENNIPPPDSECKFCQWAQITR